jgi:hypothetical protein
LLNFIAEKFENNELDNSDMVQIIELCGMYLNLQTISDYAKEHNLSYNGVKNHRQIVNLFGNKYVLENN